jgi:tRNA nucleotidyltransferase (CCA-adding enzyme)
MAEEAKPNDELLAALRSDHPELDAIASAGEDPVYLVGGAVRDRLLGRERSDIDVVVVGDAVALARALGAEPLAEHARFATAKVELAGHEVDIATARSETYSRPGALPEVALAPSIEADLGRRDFTVNAIALPLRGPAAPIDPHGGVADLERGLLRVLHPDSFVDDPTRAIRAARYAARFGFELEAETERLLRATDLTTVSADRRDAELRRLAEERSAVQGLSLLARWGLIAPRPDGLALAAAVDELLAGETWRGEVDRPEALLAAALGPPGAEQELAAAHPSRPSEGFALAHGHAARELLLARALGAEWLDSHLLEWLQVRLEIDGADLIAAGVPQGPAVGRGLDAALRAKLDGEVSGREAELDLALAAAGF